MQFTSLVAIALYITDHVHVLLKDYVLKVLIHFYADWHLFKWLWNIWQSQSKYETDNVFKEIHKLIAKCTLNF